MIVIVTEPDDRAAMELAARLSCDGARPLLPRDLSNAGWVFDCDAPDLSTACIGGERIPCSAIDAVVGRLPVLLPQHLPHIAAADRDYVAQEMTAFLLVWLAALQCPMFNRPTPCNLMGPAWHSNQWRAAAVRAGFRLAGPRPDSALEGAAASDGATVRVTVVGNRVLGASCVEKEAIAGALRLAESAGCDLVTLLLIRDGMSCRFLDAYPSADLGDETVCEALLETITATSGIRGTP
ncbi:MAG: hypothetical protein JST22_12545 [Bacteroidetes bacterium]|nr:hypothetical protein [Bacteroidota bacterium]